MAADQIFPEKFKSSSFTLIIATFLRLGFLIYGEWQDRHMLVKYTDVDYHVFTDAARYVAEGESPYNRSTYRYTPILAYMLLPNIWLTVAFGKVLFIICDVATGVLIYELCLERRCPKITALLASILWHFNPMPITVSSRGNAESVLCVLVLLTLHLIQKRKLILSAFFYGLSVHMKIYPVTYCLPIYLFINEEGVHGVGKFILWKKTLADTIKNLLPGKSVSLFIIISLSTFLGLTAACYHLYGMTFLNETYLYHVTRKDTRHNFSPYFYMLYLTAEHPSSGIIGLLAFLPQAVLLLVISLVYYSDLPFCCFLHTFIFVTFNKVCTSQYFLWYLCLLPVIIPNLKIGVRRGICMVAAWFLGQGLWLLPAYYLEFKGQDTFLFIWLAGLLFFVINIWITGEFIKNYQISWTVSGRKSQHKRV